LHNGASTAITDLGQHTGLAAQVAGAGINAAILYAGGNDFTLWNGTYDAIYNGTLTDQQVQDKIDSILYNVDLAVDTLITAGVPYILVRNVQQRNYPTRQGAGKARVDAAIEEVNDGILAIVAAHPGQVGLIDFYGWPAVLAAQYDIVDNAYIVGGEAISFATNGDEPHHCILGDGIHMGTVLSGLAANAVIDAFNAYFDGGLTRLSDAEILAQAGIT
jgi:hypothetical protein